MLHAESHVPFIDAFSLYFTVAVHGVCYCGECGQCSYLSCGSIPLCVCVIDGSMMKLYNGGEGVVLKQCVRWLQSSDVDGCKVLSALAIGNFACNGLYRHYVLECVSVCVCMCAISCLIGCGWGAPSEHSGCSLPAILC